MVRSRWCDATPSPTDKAPCGSKSTSRTRRPYSVSAAPRLIVEVVLPTPPFWLQIANTRAGPCRSSGGGCGTVRRRRPVGSIPSPGAPSSEEIGAVGATSGCCADAQVDMKPNPPSHAVRCPGSLAPGPRMGSRIDLTQVVYRHQCVDLRRGDGGMPQQFLHHPHVRTTLQQVSRKRVPQGVR